MTFWKVQSPTLPLPSPRPPPGPPTETHSGRLQLLQAQFSAGGSIINLQALTEKRGEKETKSGFSLENDELMPSLWGTRKWRHLEMGRSNDGLAGKREQPSLALFKCHF